MCIVLLILSLVNIFMGITGPHFDISFGVNAFNFFASGFTMCGAFHMFLNYWADRRK